MIRHEWILNVRDQLLCMGFDCSYSKEAIDEALLSKEEREILTKLIYAAADYIQNRLENVK